MHKRTGCYLHRALSSDGQGTRSPGNADQITSPNWQDLWNGMPSASFPPRSVPDRLSCRLSSHIREIAPPNSAHSVLTPSPPIALYGAIFSPIPAFAPNGAEKSPNTTVFTLKSDFVCYASLLLYPPPTVLRPKADRKLSISKRIRTVLNHSGRGLLRDSGFAPLSSFEGPFLDSASELVHPIRHPQERVDEREAI